MAERPPERLDPWQVGSVLTAQHLDQMRQAVDRIVGGVRPPQQVEVRRKIAGGSAVQQFKVVAHFDDHVSALKFNGTVTIAGEFKIAKPFLLRRAPFDGLTRNGISYVYSASDERVATDDTTLDTETQVMVPEYVADDVIFAVRNLEGGTGVSVVDGNGNTEFLEWLDLNIDGRAWARKYEQ